MISFPNAKINIGLNITEKRQDGYHNIESFFYPIPLTDGLEIILSKQFQFISYGLPIDGEKKSNLCVKAYNILQEEYKLTPVSIHLFKKIPMGAGLGGGSSDGAFCLKMLNDLFELNLSNKRLEEFALELGSDCPFFIENKPKIAKGRGEIFESISVNLKNYFLLIYNPNIHISTKDAYKNVQIGSSNLSRILEKNDIKIWKNHICNDFLSPIANKYPIINQLIDELYDFGALFASMSGSGSTVYGIFDHYPIYHNHKYDILKLN